MSDRKMPPKKEEPSVNEAIKETVGQDNPEGNKETPQVKKNKMGIVVDCLLVNVRKQPSINGDIETAICKGTKVKIDDSESTNDFYRISTKEGITGFCMKKFIKVY